MTIVLLQKIMGRLEGRVMVNLCYFLGGNTEGWYHFFIYYLLHFCTVVDSPYMTGGLWFLWMIADDVSLLCFLALFVFDSLIRSF